MELKDRKKTNNDRLPKFNIGDDSYYNYRYNAGNTIVSIDPLARYRSFGAGPISITATPQY